MTTYTNLTAPRMNPTTANIIAATNTAPSSSSSLLLSSSVTMLSSLGNRHDPVRTTTIGKDKMNKENSTILLKNRLSKTTKYDMNSNMKMREGEDMTKHDQLSLSTSSSSRRSVSRRVTNESMTTTSTTDHSLRMLSTLIQSQQRRQQKSFSHQRSHCHNVGEALDPSYKPSMYDVIINTTEVGCDRPNDYYDTYIRSVIPLYVNIIRQGRLDLQYTFLSSIIESVERDGGRFIRRVTTSAGSDGSKGSSWIHVSPMLAQIYTLYRLKYEMKQMMMTSEIQEEEEIVKLSQHGNDGADDVIVKLLKDEMKDDKISNDDSSNNVMTDHVATSNTLRDSTIDVVANDDDDGTINHNHRNLMDVLCLAAVSSTSSSSSLRA